MLTQTNQARVPNLIVSQMAETLEESEIIKLAGEIKERIKNGKHTYNLTIGDFDPKIFPIPKELENEITRAYEEKETNYPPANGIPELRKAVSVFIKDKEDLNYSPEEILIAGGARPLIYATYQTIIDHDEKVIFPIPSWNNNHYSHLTGARAIAVKTDPKNNFMPKAADIKPYIKEASLISLCSPLNPTGTVFTKRGLEEICEIILEENNRRSENKKPLYLMYDQIYHALTFGETTTGLRLGWTFGPQRIIDKMKAILSHLGAWAPRAEQVATARYLAQNTDNYLTQFKEKIQKRLEAFYHGFISLKQDGFKVDAIAPQAAIYLTVKMDLHQMKKEDGSIIKDTPDITKYILEQAKTAIVPFSAFGDSPNSTWYRLSVGTCKLEEVDKVIDNLRNALSKLK